VEIVLWWIGAEAADDGALDRLGGHVTRVFELPARLLASQERPRDTLDPRRGQHSSTRILGWLASLRPPAPEKLLAITDVDLFIPILTFVFGEAQLGGRAALVSTARLAGDAADRAEPALAQQRLVKEAVHELGHAFGLLHCGAPRCAMARAASLRDVDAKSAELCLDCRTALRDRRRRGGEAP